MYDLILADPPWLYDNQQQNDPRRGGIQYETLSMQNLYDIPIYKCANKDSILICWVTFPKLMDSHYEKYNPLTIIKNWGFRPITALFVWIKQNKSGKGFYSGLGRYTNSNAEIAIIARRGKALPRINKNVKQLIISPLREHSKKPQEQYNAIEKLYGCVSCVEIFARKINPPPDHWHATGLEYDGTDIRDWIKDFT